MFKEKQMIIDGITLPTGETLDPTELASIDDNKGMATAWVTFDSTGTIEASYNVASVVETSTGQHEITFETPMNHNSYAVVCLPYANDYTSQWYNLATTTKFKLYNYQGGTYFNAPKMGVVVFGGK